MHAEAAGSAVLIILAILLVVHGSTPPQAPRATDAPGSPARALGMRSRSKARLGLITRHRQPPLDPDLIPDLAQRVAALSRSGLGPTAIWQILAERPSAFAPVAATVSTTLALGGTVAEGLITARDEESMRVLAMACAISEAGGAPLASVLETLAASLGHEAQLAQTRQEALAGPKASAQVLTWLPLGGLALGLISGVNVIEVLTLTWPGRVSLLLGIALWAIGRAWLRRQFAVAERAGAQG